MSPESPLPDGVYDVLVVDIGVIDAGDHSDTDRSTSVELVVVAGSAKGETVEVRMTVAPNSADNPLDALGLPGQLTVTDGHPSFRLDDIS